MWQFGGSSAREVHMFEQLLVGVGLGCEVAGAHVQDLVDDVDFDAGGVIN